MKLDQLNDFVVTAEVGSFKGAGDKLHLSRSTVSLAINNLERELDCPLFIRSNRALEVTKNGKIFLAKAKKLLSDAKELVSLSQNLRGKGKIEIQHEYSCPIESLIISLDLFKDQYPKVKVKIGSNPNSLSFDALKTGKTNFLIMKKQENPIQNCSLIDSLDWMKVKLLPVASPNHPLAGRKRSKKEALKADRVLLRGEYYDFMDDFSCEKGNTWEAVDLYRQKQILLSSLYWGVAPEFLISDKLETGELVLLDIKGVPPIEIQLCLYKLKEESEVVERFWELSKGKKGDSEERS